VGRCLNEQDIDGSATCITTTCRHEQEYDDDNVARIPRSVLRHHPIQSQAPQVPNTGPIVTPVITHRVSGTTHALLYLLLFFCVLFLLNGIVWPALVSFDNHLKYGDAQISTYTINGSSFMAQDDNNVVKIVITSENNAHNQVLTTIVRGAGRHALVTLSEDGSNIDVSIAGTYVTSLVPDTHGGYKWKDA